jgi:hypothetical protein
MAFLESFTPLLIETSSQYNLTRFVFLRILGVVYFFAFLSLVKQLIPLLGKKGLTPAEKYIRVLRPRFKNNFYAFWKIPTIFWFYISDRFMIVLAWFGFLLSTLLLIGFGNVITLFLLWLIYLSFVHIGNIWYGYGWEGQLLETGFIAIFMVPLFDLTPFPEYLTPIATIWLLLWLTVRMHLGSGLIKLKADQCWKDLTCLNYHFETQPIPSPLSPYWHFLPKTILKVGVLWTHIVQIIVPIFLFIPGIPRIIAGALLILFQIQLMLSGNLSFLNIVTIAPIVAVFNDGFLSKIMPDFIVHKSNEAVLLAAPTINYASWILFFFVAVMSIPVIANLFSRYQVMNTSFNQFYLVNTYGAFGSVGKVRYELVVEGTHDKLISADTDWKEYEFKAKPTNLRRKLPIIAPYQPRIDWQIWFAAMQSPVQNQWMLTFIKKLLENDKTTLGLIAKNPFPKEPPRKIRVSRYIYKFAKPHSGKIWERTYTGQWLPPLSLIDLK